MALTTSLLGFGVTAFPGHGRRLRREDPLALEVEMEENEGRGCDGESRLVAMVVLLVCCAGWDVREERGR